MPSPFFGLFGLILGREACKSTLTPSSLPLKTKEEVHVSCSAESQKGQKGETIQINV